MLNEEPERAIAVADQALAAAERADLVDIVADTLVTLGSAYGNAGRGYQGLVEIEGGLDLAERHGMVAIALRARLNLGALPNIDPAPALENNRRGLSEARRLGLRRRVLLFLTNGAEAGFWTGDWDWALPELDELLAADLEEADRMPVIEAIAGSGAGRAWRSIRSWTNSRASRASRRIPIHVTARPSLVPTSGSHTMTSAALLRTIGEPRC